MIMADLKIKDIKKELGDNVGIMRFGDEIIVVKDADFSNKHFDMEDVVEER